MIPILPGDLAIVDDLVDLEQLGNVTDQHRPLSGIAEQRSRDLLLQRLQLMLFAASVVLDIEQPYVRFSRSNLNGGKLTRKTKAVQYHLSTIAAVVAEG